MTSKKQLPTTIEDRIKAQLEATKTQVSAPTSRKISVGGKVFTLPDGTSQPGPLNVVILDYIWNFAHYKGVYKAGAPQQPDCFSMSRDRVEEGTMKPHESVPSPYSDSCQECPKNEWGSAVNSDKGKACKNQRRLLVISVDALENESNIEPLILYVSPNGLKNFDGYITNLARDGIVPQQVVTEVSFDPQQQYPKLCYTMSEKHAFAERAFQLSERYQDLLWYTPALKKDAA